MNEAHESDMPRGLLTPEERRRIFADADRTAARELPRIRPELEEETERLLWSAGVLPQQWMCGGALVDMTGTGYVAGTIVELPAHRTAVHAYIWICTGLLWVLGGIIWTIALRGHP
jgi:hypothetical protein